MRAGLPAVKAAFGRRRSLSASPSPRRPSAAEAPQCAGRDLSSVAGLAEAKAKRADDLVNADGLLWRVEKPGLPVSYLFGTVHSTDEGAMALARRAADKLAEVKIAATELGAMDAAEKANLGALTLKAGLDRDHDSLEALPPADRAAVETLMKNLGYPTEFVHRLKLWFLAVLAARPPARPSARRSTCPRSTCIWRRRRQAAGLRVVGLETPEDQIDAIAAIGPEISATLLALAARDPQLNDDVYATLLALYRQGRPAEILAVADLVGEMSAKERAAQDSFTRRLLIGRNPTMIDRAGPLLNQGAFIAVGALHLSGKDGLIERLRRAGFMVTKEW